nr:SPASM domain-containing protein [Lachnospiraceae bacterium]
MNLAEKEIVVYGDSQNLYDLKYVFDDLVFTKNTQNAEELLNLISEGNYAILCGADNKEIHDRITYTYGEEFCCTDRELIKSLNYPLSKKTEGRPFYIWGTGFWCDRFLEFLEDKPDITIEGFIDSDPKKQGQNKCGIRIISPNEVENDYFIVAAVNKEHYLEIERDLREKGFPKDNYISVHTVMDDVAGFFSRVYESDTYLPVYCRNRDDNIRILTDGNICTCCLARKSVYGNIYFNSLEEIWTSKRARIARLSLIKRAYVYCETSRCPYLCGVPKLKRDNEVIPGKYEEKESFRQWPESIAPEIDGSCNLYCKSCRKEIF